MTAPLDYAILTAEDIALMRRVASAPADELDYSDFFDDEQDHAARSERED